MCVFVLGFGGYIIEIIECCFRNGSHKIVFRVGARIHVSLCMQQTFVLGSRLNIGHMTLVACQWGGRGL